jgi:hypothetical protein
MANRVIVAVLGLLLAQPVWAQWVGIVSVNDSSLYHDPSTVRKTLTGRTIWELTDYPVTQEMRFPTFIGYRRSAVKPPFFPAV